MVLIGLVAGLGVALISPRGFETNALTIAFVCVFLSGLISFGANGLLKRQNINEVINVLFCTFIRTGLVGVAIVAVAITQSKNFAFYMLCFSIIFYMGMVSLNTWLVLPAKPNQHITGSNRD
jgi:hypothetical protein